MTEGPRHVLLSGARRYFLTGLVIILPTFLTVYVLWFLWSVVDALLAPITATLLRPFLVRETLPVLITALSLLAAAPLAWRVGFTSATFSRRLFGRAEEAFGRVPHGIPRAVKEVIQQFATSDSTFRQVAVIEYPRRGLHCICFITNPVRWDVPGRRGTAVPVYIPTTLNRTSGYFLPVPEEDVIALDLSVDGAIKAMISSGLISPREADQPLA